MPDFVRPTAEAREAARHPAPGRRPVMFQRWENLLFLHWTVDREAIQRTLPDGLWCDTFAGTGWLGIVPFAMRNIRPAGIPAVGLLSISSSSMSAPMCTTGTAVPGVWFYSLDCNQPLAVWIARLFFRLPYRNAAMHAAFNRTIGYECTRRGTGETAAYRWTPSDTPRTAPPGSLEFFLLERYYLYAARGGRLFRGQVAHAPYEFQHAGVETFSTVPTAQAGFDSLSAAPQHVVHAPGFDVRIFRLDTVT